MKNPFKFTKERPEYQELWEALSNELPSDTESVRALFEYLRLGSWKDKKMELSHKDEVERIIKSTMLEPVTDDMKKYIRHIELFRNIRSSKLALHLCTLKIGEVEDILDKADTKNELDRLHNLDYILNNLTSYIKYAPEGMDSTVSSKEELRNKVAHFVLTGDTVKSFKLRKESSEIPEEGYPTEDTDEWVSWKVNGELPKDLDGHTKIFIRTKSGNSASESRKASEWDWTIGTAEITAYKIDTAEED
jgi:hypothetical protein